MPVEWVTAGAALIRRQALAEARRAVGADLKMSGHGRKLGVKVKIDRGTLVEAVISASPASSRGAWAIVERGTSNRRQGGSSPAKAPWQRAVDAVMPVIQADGRRRFDAVMKG